MTFMQWAFVGQEVFLDEHSSMSRHENKVTRIKNLRNRNKYCVSIEFQYKSTSVLSRMLFSDWLRHSLSILFQYKSTICRALSRMPFSDWVRY